MDTALIAVGSELLHAGRRDGNGDWLCERLERLGFRVRQRSLVEDDPEAIAAMIAGLRDRCGLVVLTGGLGPTEDDLTREGVALGLGLVLERDQAQEAILRRRFVERGRPFRPHQGRQADRPAGAAWMENPMGTAPGFVVERGGCMVMALPGVPAEMRAIFEAEVEPRLRSRGSGAHARRTLKISGRYESSVDRAIHDLYGTPGATMTILAGVRGIEVHVLTEGATPDEAARRLADLEQEIDRRLGPDVFGRDDDTLEGVVGTMLRSAGKTLAVAESCTAGMLAATITRVPGSSAWFRGGLVVYDDELKVRLAGVERGLLERYGAVSVEVARALAGGARTRCGSDLAFGITGIAGPGGGSVDKPVGLVHVALDDGIEVGHWELRLPGDRELVRGRTVTWALDRLRRRLLGVER